MKKQQKPMLKHKSLFDCHFSTGMKYVIPKDRGGYCSYMGLTSEEYHAGFSERDKLLDDAIERGRGCGSFANLWKVYNGARRKGLNPIDPYEWLFNYADIYAKDTIIEVRKQKILLVNTSKYMAYYDFIYGLGSFCKWSLID